MRRSCRALGALEMFEFRWKCGGKPLKVCSGKGPSLAHATEDRSLERSRCGMGSRRSEDVTGGECRGARGCEVHLRGRGAGLAAGLGVGG